MTWNSCLINRNTGLFFLVFVFGFVVTVSAQQEPHFTQYAENGIVHNPAYAGSAPYFTISAIHREQWVGISGRPRSTNLTIHSPIRYTAIGIGVELTNDSEGLIHRTSGVADLSYRLSLKNNTKLSFGTKIGLYMVQFDRQKLFPHNWMNAEIPEWNQTYQINVGAGILYHSERFFIGLGLPKLMVNQYDTLGRNTNAKFYYFSSGYVAQVHKKWNLRIATQLKLSQPNAMNIDGTLTFIYNKTLWIGILYRHNTEVGAFIQAKLSPQLKIGIATEMGLNGLRNYSAGTYELLFSCDLNFSKSGVYSPRYF